MIQGRKIFVHARAVRGGEDSLRVGSVIMLRIIRDKSREGEQFRATEAWDLEHFKAEREIQNVIKMAEQIRKSADLAHNAAQRSQSATECVMAKLQATRLVTPPGLIMQEEVGTVVSVCPVACENSELAWVTEEVTQIYTEHNPKNLDKLKVVLGKLKSKYAGNEMLMYEIVCKKYGVTSRVFQGASATISCEKATTTSSMTIAFACEQVAPEGDEYEQAAVGISSDAVQRDVQDAEEDRALIIGLLEKAAEVEQG